MLVTKLKLGIAVNLNNKVCTFRDSQVWSRVEILPERAHAIEGNQEGRTGDCRAAELRAHGFCLGLVAGGQRMPT